MFHSSIRFRSGSPKLNISFPTHEAARAMFPACETSSVRAFVRSEAARLANALVRPVGLPQNFTNVIATFADADCVGHAALRQKRFDFVLKLLRSGRFEQAVRRRLIRQGKISAE